MKLRIARKMDLGAVNRRHLDAKDRRVWWEVYNDGQLTRAFRRLRRSWLRRTKPDAQDMRKVTPDFFASNRVESRLIRQRVLRRMKKAKQGETL